MVASKPVHLACLQTNGALHGWVASQALPNPPTGKHEAAVEPASVWTAVQARPGAHTDATVHAPPSPTRGAQVSVVPSFLQYELASQIVLPHFAGESQTLLVQTSPFAHARRVLNRSVAQGCPMAGRGWQVPLASQTRSPSHPLIAVLGVGLQGSPILPCATLAVATQMPSLQKSVSRQAEPLDSMQAAPVATGWSHCPQALIPPWQ